MDNSIDCNISLMNWYDSYNSSADTHATMGIFLPPENLNQDFPILIIIPGYFMNAALVLGYSDCSI